MDFDNDFNNVAQIFQIPMFQLILALMSTFLLGQPRANGGRRAAPQASEATAAAWTGRLSAESVFNARGAEDVAARQRTQAPVGRHGGEVIAADWAADVRNRLAARRKAGRLATIRRR